MSARAKRQSKPTRHILSLSGGKDSTALAIYMRDRVPELEYAFCDTGEELPETYEYLDRLEVYLGKKIERLNPERPFLHYLNVYRGVLPDARTRWCTRMLKIKPFERFVGEDPVINYVGIRADENRKGYISTKPNIVTRFPFVEDGLGKEDVRRILDDSGLGLPDYYSWRSRSGCFFCFFQQRIEWVGLYEEHPDLFERAKAMERVDPDSGERYTWSQRESLDELTKPSRIREIREQYESRNLIKKHRANAPLSEVFADEDDEAGCLICHL